MAVSQLPVPRVESIAAQINQSCREVDESFPRAGNSLDDADAIHYRVRVFAKLLVALYEFVHGRLHLPGAGWLLRALAPHVRGLQSFPLAIPNVGTTVVDFRDSAVMGLLNFRLGEFDTNCVLFRCVEKFLRPGDVVWDVGANVGTFTAYCSAPRFGVRAIESFEPNPGVWPVLRSLFAEQPRVHLHPFGLGAKDEQLELQLGGDSSLASIKRTSGSAGIVSVAIRHGDSAAAELNLPPPDLIKVDVEGFEAEVLAGLRQTIERRRPVIFFEHLFCTDEQIRAFVPARYHLRLLLDDGRITGDLALRELGHDTVLIPDERLAELEPPAQTLPVTV